MNAYWHRQELTESLLPKLVDGERDLFREDKVHLYHGDKKVLRDGHLILTSHRTIYLTEAEHGKKIAMDHALVKNVALKTSFFRSTHILLHLNDFPIKQEQKSPDDPPKFTYKSPPSPGYMQFSFHKGKPEDYVKNLQQALKAKLWKPVEKPKRKAADSPATGVGIGGILRRREVEQRQESRNVDDAFSDLESLMEKAKGMVALAKKFSETNDAKQNEEESNAIMRNLGIVGAVSKSDAGSKYHSILARQLADFMKSPLDAHQGMMTVTDSYALFNRAKGTDLVSPDDFLTACNLLQPLDLPCCLHKFPSGVLVLQSRSHSTEESSRRLLELIKELGPIMALDVAKKLRMSATLARQQLLAAEKALVLCRDESLEGIRFYENFFMDYDLSASQAAKRRRLQ